jgi:PAS domain S-box-containing protein
MADRDAAAAPGKQPATAVAALGEEPFRLLVESVQDYAIFLLDTQGRVATWNAGAQRIKGYHAHEIIGRSFEIFYPEEAIRADWPQQELRAAREHGRFEDEGWRLRKDGGRFWARRSNRHMSEFLAMLGHELRNPLAPIRNAVDVFGVHPSLQNLLGNAIRYARVSDSGRGIPQHEPERIFELFFKVDAGRELLARAGAAKTV